MSIRRLPPLLVNQIAAGEVIERPASVVKEAIENSIDAGAKRIEIEIEQGGHELIRISDDGFGIAFEELALAIAPHATSKIAAAADLDAIATMGFRGEALASIASVSRLSLLSRTPDQQSAALLEAAGDVVQATRPAGSPIGTTLTVRNLFFNTPARRKFLRSEQTEAMRVADIAESLALAHPSIAFTLIVDGKKKLDLPGGQLPRERALAVMGEELADELLELHAEHHGLLIWGMAGKPAIARGTAKHQRIYLNGRCINDRSIMHAIKEAYRGLIDPARHPTIVLFITIDPAQVDVNVHPAKAEVRFRNQAVVHGAVLASVKARLRAADLVPALELTPARSWSDSFRAEGAVAATLPAARPFGSGFDPARDASYPQAPPGAAPVPAPSARQFVEYFQRLDPRQKGFVYTEVKEALSRERPELLDEPALSAGEDRRPNGAAEAPLPTFRAAADILQIHSSYIVTEDEHGLVIIDQHALHERVMFEKLKTRLGDGALESQRLLMPATVEVERGQMELLQELRPLLARLGIETEPIGPASIAIHGFTTLLFERGVEPAAFLRELLDHASMRGRNDDPEAALHQVLNMMACKAAVKAGDRLTRAELAELLSYRETTDRSTNCPHGRPTTLRLSIKELERQFGRR